MGYLVSLVGSGGPIWIHPSQQSTIWTTDMGYLVSLVGSGGPTWIHPSQPSTIWTTDMGYLVSLVDSEGSDLNPSVTAIYHMDHWYGLPSLAGTWIQRGDKVIYHMDLLCTYCEWAYLIWLMLRMKKDGWWSLKRCTSSQWDNVGKQGCSRSTSVSKSWAVLPRRHGNTQLTKIKSMLKLPWPLVIVNLSLARNMIFCSYNTTLVYIENCMEKSPIVKNCVNNHLVWN